MVTTEQSGEQMPMPARQRKRGKQDGGDAGSTRAFFRAARASPKPAQKKVVELWRLKEREASGFGPTALRPLYVRSPLSPRLPPFIDQEGSRFPH